MNREDIITLDTLKYREVNAVSSSYLSTLEGMLLSNPLLIGSNKNKKSEAMDLGNIIDRCLWDSSYISKIINIDCEPNNIGYKAWKENKQVIDYYNEVTKVIYLNYPIKKSIYDKLCLNYYDENKKRWKAGRDKDESLFTKQFTSYQKIKEEINSYDKIYNTFNKTHGLYSDLVEKHNNNEIVLLNLLFDNPNEVYQTIVKMVESIEQNKDYKKLFKDTSKTKDKIEIYYQQPLYFDYQVYTETFINIECKALPDVIIINNNDKTISIVDLKTTQYDDFRMYKSKRYFRQLAFYKIGVIEHFKINDFNSLYYGYNVDCYILNVKYKIKNKEGLEPNVYVDTQLLTIMKNDLDTANIGGIIKPDWQTECVMNRINCTWSVNNEYQIEKLGIDLRDKRYKVYSIYELILKHIEKQTDGGDN